jgi:DNA end-binding protein Ku
LEFRVPTVRPYWKGYIKLALVSCPIAVYTASSSGERVAFRQLNKKTGNRLRQQLVDDVTREPVDKGRGYEYAKNAYLLIEDEEIESIEVESNHMIEIDSFVPRDQIDERYLDSPYYIGPNDPVGQEAFAVIREAMRGKGMVALGRVVIAKRERVIMLQPWEKGLLGTTLRYPYEVRDSKDYFYDIPDVNIAPDMLKLAEHILQSKETTFDPSQFVDRYEQAVLQLLEKKQQGAPAPKARPFVAPTNVINLMDTLRRSIAEEAKAGAAPKTAAKAPATPAAATAAANPKKGKKRVPGQGELLMPIAGRKEQPKPETKPATQSEVTKPATQPAGRRKAG